MTRQRARRRPQEPAHTQIETRLTSASIQSAKSVSAKPLGTSPTVKGKLCVLIKKKRERAGHRQKYLPPSYFSFHTWTVIQNFFFSMNSWKTYACWCWNFVYDSLCIVRSHAWCRIQDSLDTISDLMFSVLPSTQPWSQMLQFFKLHGRFIQHFSLKSHCFQLFDGLEYNLCSPEVESTDFDDSPDGWSTNTMRVILLWYCYW